MIQLSRKKVNEMVKREQNISSRHSSGGSGAGGGGGVSSAWVDEHYVSKDFFARLFTINGTTTEGGVTTDVVVEPNDLETTITNIQAMVGLWTEEYLSALGQGSGGGGGGSILTEPLASINEAGLGTPSGSNKVIVWNGITWTYMPYTTGSGTVTSVTMTVPTGFKVSNGDTQTINTTGSFDLTFGGTITKNQVLASPAAANGTPAWRALVADDIPTLTAAKISDITLTNGTLTIGNNSITPITDATLKSDYVWWGQALNNDGAVTGDITVGNGSIYLNNGKNIICKDSDGTDRSVIGINTSNLLRIGYGHSAGGTDHETVIYGSKVKLYYYDTSRSFGVVLDNNGNVGIGATSPLYKLHVNGYTKTSRLYLTDSVYLEYDSSNSGVHLVGAGLYTDTYVSALGAGSGGGGGSTTLTEPLASINEAGMGSPSGTNKVIVYTSSGWSYMPYTTGGSGSLTSVGLSMPTGFTVTGTPVTGSGGTLTVAFGGSVSKNRVLAAPSDAAGVPSWRTLVASDIPTLTASKISDIGISNGTITIGSNSITPLTDATLKSNYTWWGQTMNNNGAVTGSITVGNGYILLNNDKGIFSYNVPAEGEYAIPIEMMKLRSNNSARLFYGAAQAGYTTLVCGNAIGFRYGDGSTNAMVITQTGLITMGTSGTSSFVTEKLNVNGNIRTATANGSYIQIGAVRLVYDSTNTAIKVEKSDGTAAGLYATGFLSSLGAGSGGGGGASDYIPISGSSSITGSLTPATRNTYDLGSATKAWNTLYVNSISGNASLSVQGVSCTTFSTSARAVISSGAKFASICVESDSSGSMSSSRVGEINRYNGSLHLQYDSGTANVTMCRHGFVFSTYTDGGGNNLSVIDTNNRSLRIELGSSSLNPYISKPWNEGSDIRLKNIVKTIEDFDIQEIANAPVFDFTYKNDDAKIIYLGTSAQYWQKVMPSAVKEMGDGYLSMNYGGTALAAAVLTARKVVNHEERILELERENMKLRKEIELLKAA